MSRKASFIIHPAALEEAEEATRWYRQRSAQAAEGFVHEVNHALDRIQAAPQRWPSGIYGTRKILLHRFPFLVIYRELSSAIQVLAVAHCRRRPGYWKTRIHNS